jgi:hypothetical protein
MAARKETMRCNNCEYSEYYSDRFFECRKNPPQADSEFIGERGRFPLVLSDDWCGDFELNVNMEETNNGKE